MVLNQRQICLCVSAFMLLCASGCERGKSAPAAANASFSAAQPPQSSSVPQMQASGPQGPALRINAERAMQYVKDIVTIGPRWPGSKGQEKTAAYLRAKLKNDNLTED